MTAQFFSHGAGGHGATTHGGGAQSGSLEGDGDVVGAVVEVGSGVGPPVFGGVGCEEPHAEIHAVSVTENERARRARMRRKRGMTADLTLVARTVCREG
jgi:hypothetical protein